MLDIQVKLSDNFLATKEALLLLGEKGLPNTEKAVKSSLVFVQEEWRKQANSIFKHRTGNYNSTIKIEYPTDTEKLQGKVITTLPYAHVLENGMTSEERMRILQTSHQVRINKKGGKYLIIPFRHGSPGSTTLPPMPKTVYAQAKELTQSKRTGTYYELSQQLGQPEKGINPNEPRARSAEGVPMAQRFSYQWGERLTGVGGVWEGMYKFGVSHHTQYITFRVMSEHGKPWQGIPAFKVCEKTVRFVKSQVIGIVKTGFRQDMIDFKNIAARA